VCAVEPLRELARRHGLLLLEDAAQAHGATYRDACAGSLGDAAAFSFYPSKNLGALGDAGAICTADGALASAARQLRDLGRGSDGSHASPGYNERLDGIQAALLRAKLPRLDGWNADRRRVAAVYRERLPEDVELLAESPLTPCTYHVFPIRVERRDEFAAELSARGIGTRIHYPLAVPDHAPLEGLAKCATAPVRARQWAARELSLPIFPAIGDGELELVIEAVGGVIAARSAGPHRRRNGAPAAPVSGLTGSHHLGKVELDYVRLRPLIGDDDLREGTQDMGPTAQVKDR
jgi:dTDP-4-amino-4,6-dideoxygalactose transaminase